MIELKRILLPTDFSEPSLAATRHAVDLAERFEATLHLLHVIEDPVVYLPMFESYPLPAQKEFEQYAQTRLESWILPDDAARIAVETHWVHGSPFAQILEAARMQQSNLIVMGTHGRGAAAHLFLGSVAERIVRQAPCPVLTIRPDGGASG